MRLIASDSNVDFGVVAGDDLDLLSPDFNANWDLLHEPATWTDTDMIYLQACGYGWDRDLHAGYREERPSKLIDVTGQQVYCTGMYAVTRDAARRLTEKGTPLLPIKDQIDSIIPIQVPSLRAKLFSPPIAQTLGRGDPGIGSDV